MSDEPSRPCFLSAWEEGAKSRLQRARRRLEDHLSQVCQVRRDEDGRVCCFVPRPAEAEGR